MLWPNASARSLRLSLWRAPAYPSSLAFLGYLRSPPFSGRVQLGVGFCASSFGFGFARCLFGCFCFCFASGGAAPACVMSAGHFGWKCGGQGEGEFGECGGASAVGGAALLRLYRLPAAFIMAVIHHYVWLSWRGVWRDDMASLLLTMLSQWHFSIYLPLSSDSATLPG